MSTHITINDRKIGPGYPTYCVAELSANHNGSLATAFRLVSLAKEAGADAVKVQTYTPDTITIKSDRPEFFHGATYSAWEDDSLYSLYEKAHMPWDWQPLLKEFAEKIGLDFFSTPFDTTAVDFLENLEVPIYKVASYELVDIPLLRYIAKTGKPIILSTGMASLGEIGEAIRTIKSEDNYKIALLKCTSAYPAPLQEMNLRSMADLADYCGYPIGLSDHTLNYAVPVAAVALGACIIEKHLTLSRLSSGVDVSFSLTPAEFKSMVSAIRDTETALGNWKYEVSVSQEKSRQFRRSLYVVADVLKGEQFTPGNVRSIRPANGLHTRHLPEVLTARASQNITKGTPLHWVHVQNSIL